jgi:DNA-binding NarL/FixJ family response regulator
MGQDRFSIKLKVAIVDDSLIVVERLQHMLSEINELELTGTAQTVSSARLLIGRQRPDVVILDIYLEEEYSSSNGLNLLEELKQNYWDMKIIMLSNVIEPHYRSASMLLGADYFFDKSNEFEKIPAALKEIILKRNEC